MSNVSRVLSLTLATFLALLAPLIGTTVAVAAPTPGVEGRALLYRKHVDAAHIAWEADGLHVRVVDGSTVRSADDVAIRLGPDAAADGTEVSRLRVGENSPELSFLGKPGTIHWLAPSAYYEGWPPVWAGMGAGKFPDELFTNPIINERVLPESVHLTLDAVDGPGSVEMFNWNSTSGTVGRHLSSTDSRYKAIYMTPNAHGHFNWTFSQPGRYQLTMTAHAKTQGGKALHSPASSVVWLVGSDAEVGLPAGTTKAAKITKPVDAPVATPTSKPTQPTTAPTSTAPTSAPYDPLAFNPTKDRTCAHLGKGHMDIAGRFDGTFDEDKWPTAPTLTLAEDSTGKVIDRPSYKTALELGEHAKFTLGTSPGAQALRDYFGSGSTLYTLPEAQDPNLPWLGFNTEHTDYSQLDHAKFAVSIEGPPGAKFAMGHTDAQGNFVVELDTERNGQNMPLRFFEKTHTHKAFFFDKPGFYDVNIDYTVVGKGKSSAGDTLQNYGSFTTTFAVGQAAIDHACERVSQPTMTPSASATPTASSTSTSSAPVPTSTPAPTNSTTAPTAAPTSSAPAPSTAPLILDHGHVDAFQVSARGDKLHLQLSEDVTGAHVPRTPESVVLHVKPEAAQDIPAGLPGSPRGYLLPMTQNPNLLWPGWDTNAVRDAGVGEVRFVIGVEGPGDVHVFSSDFTGLKSLLADGGTKLPGDLVAPFPAHTHANWVFTKAGQYKFTVTATGTKGAQKLTSNTAVYTWQVGPLPTTNPPVTTPGAPALDAKPAPGASGPAPVPPKSAVAPAPRPHGDSQTAAGGTLSGSAPVTSPAARGGEKCIPTKIQVPAAQGAATATASVATSGHFDVGARLEGGNFTLSVKDDRKQPPAWTDPKAIAFGLGAAAVTKAPPGMEFIAAAGTPIHVVSSVQQPEVPWIGVNTMHESIVNGTTGTVTLRLDGVEGPGKMAAFMSGALGGGVGQRMFDNVGGPKDYTIPANTHAHPNWVFSAPGLYKVTLTASATGKDGKALSAASTLTFQVGDVKAAAPVAAVATGKPAMVEKTVGRTASGAECNLASTGVSIHPGFIAGAAALVLLGGAVIVGTLRRR